MLVNMCAMGKIQQGSGELWESAAWRQKVWFSAACCSERPRGADHIWPLRIQESRSKGDPDTLSALWYWHKRKRNAGVGMGWHGKETVMESVLQGDAVGKERLTRGGVRGLATSTWDLGLPLQLLTSIHSTGMLRKLIYLFSKHLIALRISQELNLTLGARRWISTVLPLKDSPW